MWIFNAHACLKCCVVCSFHIVVWTICKLLRKILLWRNFTVLVIANTPTFSEDEKKWKYLHCLHYTLIKWLILMSHFTTTHKTYTKTNTQQTYAFQHDTTQLNWTQCDSWQFTTLMIISSHFKFCCKLLIYLLTFKLFLYSVAISLAPRALRAALE